MNLLSFYKVCIIFIQVLINKIAVLKHCMSNIDNFMYVSYCIGNKVI